MVDREDTLSKIQKLIALAGNNPFSAEAEAARAKADELMQQYRVETWELQFVGDPKDLEEPVLKWIKVEVGGREDLRRYILSLASYCGRHAECRVATRYNEVAFVGYPTDVRYGEMLYTYLYTQMMLKLAPAYDHDKTFAENLVAFKEAGMKWAEMHKFLQPDVPFERRHGVRYTGIYTKYCKEHNRHRTYSSPTQYFEGFVLGFLNEVMVRFYRQEQRMDLEGGIVLKGRKEKVDEAFYEHFPHLRPQPVIHVTGEDGLSNKPVRYRAPKEKSIAGDAFRAGQDAAKQADLIDRSGQAPRNLEG